MDLKMKVFITLFFALVSLQVMAVTDNNPVLVGWASVNADGQNGTNGGEGGSVVTVTNMDDLIIYCNMTSPYIIQIDRMINISPKGRLIAVKSNKTITGISPGSGISQGGFSVGNSQKNIIFNNLIISDTYLEGDWDGKEQDWDGIQIKGTCSHIWVHKCTFLRQGDGALDITNGANYVTVSYCKFGQNNKASLIGNTDTDVYTDRYKVTMHHNWFDETTQRHPRVRFGMVHLFNNYYYNMGGYGRAMGYAISNGYGIGVGVSAKIYSEKNYFEKVVYPVQFYDSSEKPGFIIDVGSFLNQSGPISSKPEGLGWNPADYYTYTVDSAELVKSIVMSNAGADIATNGSTVSSELTQFKLAVYPNPVTDYAKLSFVLPEYGKARLTMFDITGRKINELSNQYYPAGMHEILLSGNELNKGIYFISLEFNGIKLTHKIILK
jgi:pectate lyase